MCHSPKQDPSVHGVYRALFSFFLQGAPEASGMRSPREHFQGFVCHWTEILLYVERCRMLSLGKLRR